MGQTINIKLDELLNDFENPRHDIAVNEEDAVKKLIEKVGGENMLRLAEDIYTRGLIPSNEIVVIYNEDIGKYVVYEGNRRVAIMKILKDPEQFSFLKKTFLASIEKIKANNNPVINFEEIKCYVTNVDEALFIMERQHSGEDRGRGLKAWTPREKDIFKNRRNNSKTVPAMIDEKVREYYNNKDITQEMKYTNLGRIFNNRGVKKIIGISDEASLDKKSIDLILSLVSQVNKRAERDNTSVSRMLNRARDTEDLIIALIEESKSENDPKTPEEGDVSILKVKTHTIIEGTELTLKDLINEGLPVDKIKIFSDSNLVIRDKFVVLGDNHKGEYTIGFTLNTNNEDLHLKIEEKKVKKPDSFEIINHFVKVENGNSVNLHDFIKYSGDASDLRFHSTNLVIAKNGNVSATNAIGEYSVRINLPESSYSRIIELQIYEKKKPPITTDLRLQIDNDWLLVLDYGLAKEYDRKITSLLTELIDLNMLGLDNIEKFNSARHLLVLSLLEVCFLRYTYRTSGNLDGISEGGLHGKIMQVINKMAMDKVIDKGEKNQIKVLVNDNGYITTMNSIKHSYVLGDVYILKTVFSTLRCYIAYCINI
ncbi:hypothetical protein DUK53_04680 [Listeria sp. SHR_NRA_18]|uniref:hypothetical protein n=1 Tax=Listeria sp. SHR_NRA_18 TaxID=2269046 RepID=UPI00051CC8AD|nr:hypothetical protein [Listeria sp. SHR_NRA_18]KGL42097.1 hypothetical protein EP56_10180 [Listeriaceae bacterium FSL A5-0209]RQW67618.1 hypothetical protein DUK53_04680 [Listeria sp. SHR_NRA_18]